ncbi:MAG: peroxisomal membrane anchor protein conserved region-domain-containing protein [Olpidium bornovanus]|uniref:Peroxisomal membrane protein PEX14 n=1 Tax=Olpidium bornovanus TaxID=278681 RepID=A0A8H8DEZ6_9FUNG|nr:MAG: peroxisomal membrane anchor protein conserved region-domain-containing protein [Olpidium bornovanus]
MRADVLASATRFLQDPAVQSAALAKKVAFLESKGLTADEIGEALWRSKPAAAPGPDDAAAGPAAQQPPPPPQPYYHYPLQPAAPPLPPARPPAAWKDVVSGAVAFAGVSYGAFALAQPDGGPHPNFSADVRAAERRLDEQVRRAEEALGDVRRETEKIVASVAEQSERTTSALVALGETMAGLKESDERRDEEFEAFKRELEEIKAEIPTVRLSAGMAGVAGMAGAGKGGRRSSCWYSPPRTSRLIPSTLFDRTKESQTAVLHDLQAEVKSLKALLLNRRVGSVPGGAPAARSPSRTPSATGARTPQAGEKQADDRQPQQGTAFPYASGQAGFIPPWQLVDGGMGPKSETKTAMPLMLGAESEESDSIEAT